MLHVLRVKLLALVFHPHFSVVLLHLTVVIHNVQLIQHMIFENFMAFALGSFMIFILNNLVMLMMIMLRLRPIQPSKLLNKLLSCKANKLICLLNKRVPACHLLAIAHGLEFLLIVVVELIDFFHVLVDDHLLVVL